MHALLHPPRLRLTAAPPALPRAPQNPRAPYRGAHLPEHAARSGRSTIGRHRLTDDGAGGRVRKVSGRLFNDGSARRTTRSTVNAGAAQVNGTADPDGNTHPASRRTTSADSVSLGASLTEAGYQATAALLQVLVLAYQQLSSFQCAEAVTTLRRLPVAQYDTGWVFVQLGRAYCEGVEYHKAEAAFMHARIRDPYSLEVSSVCGGLVVTLNNTQLLSLYVVGMVSSNNWSILIHIPSCSKWQTMVVLLFVMSRHAQQFITQHTIRQGMDVFSTVLWHLRKEVELSHLAQDATDLDRLAPQTWCIMGNCFSLQREHETALKCFTRALQLDPAFTYAYTLRGHELFANEDFDEAIKSYRQATRINHRHYNAWCGVVLVLSGWLTAVWVGQNVGSRVNPQ